MQGSDQEIENGLRVVGDNAGDHQGIPLLAMVFINLLASNDLSYYAKSIFMLHERKNAIKACACHLHSSVFMLVKYVF